MSEWISVEERLPDIGHKCLIRIPVCSSSNIESGTYKGDGVWIGAWCDSRGKGNFYAVTHWMDRPEEPLPC